MLFSHIHFGYGEKNQLLIIVVRVANGYGTLHKQNSNIKWNFLSMNSTQWILDEGPTS